MGKLRLFLVLLLSVALDFSSPVMPEGMEVFEEMEEQAHRVRARRVVVQGDREAAPHDAPRPESRSTVRPAPPRRPVTDTGTRKIPPPASDSTSPEDH